MFVVLTGDPDSVDWIRRLLGHPPDQSFASRAPAAEFSRQQWQVIVEFLVDQLRDHYSQPAFGVSEAEISMHYHLPAGEICHLIRRRLGLDEGAPIHVAAFGGKNLGGGAGDE